MDYQAAAGAAAAAPEDQTSASGAASSCSGQRERVRQGGAGASMAAQARKETAINRTLNEYAAVSVTRLHWLRARNLGCNDLGEREWESGSSMEGLRRSEAAIAVP